MRRGTTIALAAAVFALTGSAVAAGFGAIDRPAAARVPASRQLPQLQVAPIAQPPRVCRRVVVIGDSLTEGSEPWLVAELETAGFTAFVDAQRSRRIPATVRPPYSGVSAALAARGTFGDAECWVIALGSNDLIHVAGKSEAVSARLVDEMLAAVTPDALVWWINVDYRHDPRAGFDMVAATRRFNAALAERDAALENLMVLDWYALAEANRHWFVDPVHVGRTGSIVRAKWTVAALPRPG